MRKFASKDEFRKFAGRNIIAGLPGVLDWTVIRGRNGGYHLGVRYDSNTGYEDSRPFVSRVWQAYLDGLDYQDPGRPPVEPAGPGWMFTSEFVGLRESGDPEPAVKEKAARRTRQFRPRGV